MKTVSDFDFIKNIKKTEYVNTSITLIFKDKNTGILLQGERLAAQFQCPWGYLLITDFNYYDGVDYWYYFLNNALEIKDVVSQPEDPVGYMEAIRMTEPHTLQFAFYTPRPDGTWRLELHPKPFWDMSPSVIRLRPLRFAFKKRTIVLSKC
ncbi:hypothetical protein [Leptospira alstonii]|uniref:Uncharacterized protein n=2 Tax=Leptospira alstonii TaxID=28452 RepID=M6CII0_9LEPT|nr:hypothetical protein [Leptospira alstonii]EMJ91697.1 hypothetical protein LEP1GSC194_2206 [Leptospira alstonii serovar Sichuan str. 79601]EQA81292.1 hypothetical protein LEP1GSC193_3576 [Leptospira alstonii serovar Pingchang str. 80-412]